MFPAEHLCDADLLRLAEHLAADWATDVLDAALARAAGNARFASRVRDSISAMELLLELERCGLLRAFVGPVLLERRFPSARMTRLMVQLRTLPEGACAGAQALDELWDAWSATERRHGHEKRLLSWIAEIRVGGSVRATGVLVGPATVLTCSHAITRNGMERADVALGVVVRFDSDPSAEVGLARERWVTVLGSEAGLDYGLLRLDRPVGDGLISGSRLARGWMHLGRHPHPADEVAAGEVISHSAGRPVSRKPASEPRHEGGKVTYRIDTSPGASGGLYFDLATCRPVGLHVGDPSDGRLSETGRRSAIPLSVIWGDLVRLGLAGSSPVNPHSLAPRHEGSPLIEVAGDDRAPLLDRRSFVDVVRSRVHSPRPATGSVIVVHGPPGCGRSFASRILSTIVASDHHVVLGVGPADARSNAPPTPFEIFEDIAEQMARAGLIDPGRSPDRQRIERNSTARQAKQLVSAIASCLRRIENRTIWIVVDDADMSCAPFVEELHAVASSVPTLNVVLIGYQGLENVGRYTREPFVDLSDDDVKEYFANACANYSWGLPDDRLNAEVEGLLADLPAYGSRNRVRAVAKAVRRLRDRLNDEAVGVEEASPP